MEGSLTVSMKIKSHTFDSVILCLVQYTWAHIYSLCVSSGEILEKLNAQWYSQHIEYYATPNNSVVVDLYAACMVNSPKYLLGEKNKLQNYHIYVKKKKPSELDLFLYVLHFIDSLCIMHMKSIYKINSFLF